MTAGRRSILTGLIGQGVAPSLSPELHEREAQRQGIRYVYKTIDLGDDQLGSEHLRALLGFAVRLGFDGLNVTHPVKQAMVPLVDELAPGAAAIGALNTVLVSQGRTVGHNTDVSGFTRAFTDGLAGAALDEVVLLGAGGAGTAVAHALVRLGVLRLDVVDPDPSRTALLAASVRRLGGATTVVERTPADVPVVLGRVSGLVNATPVGMAAHPGSPVDERQLHPDLWVADIVYRPLHTELLRAASARGCRTMSGAGMAVHQAADAFELITGLPADRVAMTRDFEALVAAEAQAATLPSNRARQDTGERNP